jgi:ribosomal protein L37AE/L43A
MNKCEICGHNRWKTKINGKKWECRKCGSTKENIEEKPNILPSGVMMPEVERYEQGIMKI